MLCTKHFMWLQWSARTSRSGLAERYIICRGSLFRSKRQPVPISFQKDGDLMKIEQAAECLLKFQRPIIYGGGGLINQDQQLVSCFRNLRK